MDDTPKWKCIVCGRDVESGVVFCAIKEPRLGFVLGDCCKDVLRERRMNPESVFAEEMVDRFLGRLNKDEDKEKTDCSECDKSGDCEKGKAQKLSGKMGSKLPPVISPPTSDTVN